MLRKNQVVVRCFLSFSRGRRSDEHGLLASAMESHHENLASMSETDDGAAPSTAQVYLSISQHAPFVGFFSKPSPASSGPTRSRGEG